MISVYDVMKERLQTAEGTMMVTILSGPRKGDKTIYGDDGAVLHG